MPTPGLISHIQRYSLHDGPGIRTTVFLKGCPLHCAWCHNPENISGQPEIVFYEARCVRCGACASACPQDQGSVPIVDLGAQKSVRLVKEILPGRGGPNTPPTCTLCGACVEACPTGARSQLGTPMSPHDVLDQVLADRIFFEESRGGVTFSGGEPLRQSQFLKEILTACQEEGIHTAVDTCGYASPDELLAIAAGTNLFLYDLKFMDDRRHREFTGVSNSLILDNLSWLTRNHPRIWLRIPVIPGINDSPDELEAMAVFASGLPAIEQVNLIPYHRTGVAKFERLGRLYALGNIEPPSAQHLQSLAAHFQHHGLLVKTGG